MTPRARVGVLGAGALGSHAVARLPSDLAALILDVDVVVAAANLATSRFEARDDGRPKAIVAAERHRARGGVAWGLHADVRYAFRPGLARTLDAVIVALDNVSALRDVAETVWDAGIEDVPVFVATCGNAATGGGHLVRVFQPGRSRVCPVCFFGDAERAADRRALGASCAATTAPRASAEAADGAAAAVIALLLRWLAGDRTTAGTRVQQDAAGAWSARMPATPTAGCPVAHHPMTEPVLDLPGDVDASVVADVVVRARRHAGDDAVLSLGRRGVAAVGIACERCRRVVAPAPMRLLPAAVAGCACGGTLEPLAARSVVGIDELAGAGIDGLSLRAFGCAPGDELVAVGSTGVARMRAAFDWSELA